MNDRSATVRGGRARLGLLLCLPAALAAACDSDDKSSSGAPDEDAIRDVKAFVATNLDDLVAAAKAIQSAAPAPDADGWSLAKDAAAVNGMRDSWRRARVAYERVEGAIAVLFPELDVATDERYDGFLTDTGPDANLFDGQGVTGVHAIERILWADSTRPEVVKFEMPLAGYSAPAFPTTMQQAADFKNGLAAQLVDDTTKMRDMFKPLTLDAATAYRGVIGSIEEQLEKVTLAATGEEESRYANETLADMRANVEGGKATAAAFKPWLLSKEGGKAISDAIEAGFKRLTDEYARHTGPKLPPVPDSWSSVNPSPTDLQTEFGKLYKLLSEQSDPEAEGSLVGKMEEAATAMGIPVLQP